MGRPRGQRHRYLEVAERPLTPGQRLRKPVNDKIQIRSAEPADLPRLVEIARAAAHIDDYPEPESLGELTFALSNPAPLQVGSNLAVALVADQITGYHRLRVFSDPSGLLVLSHRGQVDPGYRGYGLGSALFQQAETVLRAHAADHDGPATLSSWCYVSETGAVHLAERAGYQPHRTMIQMERCTADPPTEAILPAGLEVRPAVPADFQAIFDAYIEASADDLDAVASSEEAFSQWVALLGAQHPRWQVAWDGAQVAGMVLNYLPDAGPEQGLVGRTEYVAVRRTWRKRGLATVLLERSLVAWRAAGMQMVSLDVNEGNPTGAGQLYFKLGYTPRRKLVIYRRKS